MRSHKEDSEFSLKESTRLEAFSDGVFAIAITLLVLELIQALHPETDKRLLDHLLSHWQSFLAFIIGFITILICWINHHLVFTYVKKVDSSLMWVNGFVLLIVTFTPFPTAILAEYIETEKHVAMAVYGGNYFLMSIAAYCITAYVYKKSLIEEASRELFFYYKRLYLYSIFYTFLIFFICFLSVPLALILYFLLFIVFAYPKEFATRLLNWNRRKNTKQVKADSGDNK